MISKIKLQTRTFLFTCTILIILVCSLIFALVPSKAFADDGYFNHDCNFSPTLIQSYSAFLQTFPNDTIVFGRYFNGNPIILRRDSPGLFADYAYGSNRIEALSGTAFYTISGDLIPTSYNTIWSNFYLGSDITCIADVQLGSSMTAESFYYYEGFPQAQTSLYPILNPYLAPPEIYYPIKPVATYLIQDKTVTVDCFQSGFFEDNPENLTEIPQTCRFYLDYLPTSESGEYYYTGVDTTSTVYNVLNSDFNSPEHLLTGTGQTVINMVETNNGKVIFTLPSPVDYGTYYLKTVIVNDYNITKSISIIPLVFDGGVQEGNSSTGDYVPPLYTDCSVFEVLSGNWFSCNFDNFKIGFFQLIKALFIPDLTSLRTQLDDKKSIIIERSGFLGQSFYAIIDFFTTAIEYADEPDCTLSFGTVFNGSAPIDFDFCTLKNTSPTLFSALQNILVITTLISFLFASYFALIKLFYGGSD